MELSLFPQEVLWNVCLCLEIRDALSVCECNKQLKGKIHDQDGFWAFLLEQEWGAKEYGWQFGGVNPDRHQRGPGEWRRAFRYFVEELPKCAHRRRLLQKDPRVLFFEGMGWEFPAEYVAEFVKLTDLHWGQTNDGTFFCDPTQAGRTELQSTTFVFKKWSFSPTLVSSDPKPYSNRLISSHKHSHEFSMIRYYVKSSSINHGWIEIWVHPETYKIMWATASSFPPPLHLLGVTVDDCENYKKLLKDQCPKIK